MIKSYEQAMAVQDRRANSGKRGYAKAVRRYLLNNHKDRYQSRKAALKAIWPKKKKKAEPKVKAIDLTEIEAE